MLLPHPPGELSHSGSVNKHPKAWAVRENRACQDLLQRDIVEARPIESHADSEWPSLLLPPGDQRDRARVLLAFAHPETYDVEHLAVCRASHWFSAGPPGTIDSQIWFAIISETPA